MLPEFAFSSAFSVIRSLLEARNITDLPLTSSCSVTVLFTVVPEPDHRAGAGGGTGTGTLPLLHIIHNNNHALANRPLSRVSIPTVTDSQTRARGSADRPPAVLATWRAVVNPGVNPGVKCIHQKMQRCVFGARDIAAALTIPRHRLAVLVLGWPPWRSLLDWPRLVVSWLEYSARLGEGEGEGEGESCLVVAGVRC